MGGRASVRLWLKNSVHALGMRKVGLMGTNIPGTRRTILAWAEGLIGKWGTNQAAIGLTSAQVIELSADIARARAAFTNAERIRAESKAATQSFYADADAVHTKASKAVTAIKSFARNSTDPAAVYLLAGITGQNPPSPAPAPEQPSNLEAHLQNDGSVTLTWDGKGPGGTIYEVYRRRSGEAAFTFLVNVGSRHKVFNDNTIPAGTTFISYQVRAMHGDKFSAFSAQTNLQIGPVVPPVAQAA